VLFKEDETDEMKNFFKEAMIDDIGDEISPALAMLLEHLLIFDKSIAKYRSPSVVKLTSTLKINLQTRIIFDFRHI
jgi:hypothetical protein